MTKLIVLFLLSILSIAQAKAQPARAEKVFVHTVSCKTKMDGIDVRLDFFRAYLNDKEGTALEEGYYIQTSGGEEGMRTMGAAEFMAPSATPQGPATTNRILVHASLEPKVTFAIIDMPIKMNNTPVEIFATSWNKVWGTFSCNSK